MTDTKRRLDLRINEDLAAYANDRAYRTQRTISEVVEEGLKALRDQPVLRALARNLLAMSRESFEWLATVPLPEELLDVPDTILSLEHLAEHPAEWLALHGDDSAERLIDCVRAVGLLRAWRRARTAHMHGQSGSTPETTLVRLGGAR